jgi:hypothetical protein
VELEEKYGMKGKENRLMSQTIFIMLTANDERQKKGILLLLYSPMLCILAFSLSLALDELNCHLFHVSAQRNFFISCAGCIS